MKVLLHGHFNSFTGYGQDCIGLAKTLLLMGIDLYLHPEGIKPPIHPSIAALLTKEPPNHFDMAISHVDPSYLRPVVSADVSIAWSMWEYTSLDNYKQHRTFRAATSGYDLLLAYDKVSEQAFSEAGCPVEVLQGGFWEHEWSYIERDWFDSPIRFAMIGQLSPRKDPFIAIEAFKELVEEFPTEMAGAQLTLKTQTPGLLDAIEEWAPGVTIERGVWSRAQVRDFYAHQHVLLAPSRGEGKNLPALEFMSTGGVVAATNWGGHKQWISSEYAYPIDYTVEPTDPHRYSQTCRDARASKDHLKRIMRDIVNNPSEAKRRGETAAAVIPQMCSWTKVVERLFLRLPEWVPEASKMAAAAQFQFVDRTQPLPRYLAEVSS